jgi:hypothetical protein
LDLTFDDDGPLEESTGAGNDDATDSDCESVAGGENVVKYFHDDGYWYRGQVVAKTKEEGTGALLYRIKYDFDEKEEDFNQGQLELGILNYAHFHAKGCCMLSRWN